MAETTYAAPKQPATSAATAHKLAPVFLEKAKPVRPPYEPPDRSWIEEWESDEQVEKKDTTDRISGLPVEIIMMIDAHLTPAPLLAFSRLSRFFRSLVFTQRAESIWAGVRRREGWQDSEAGGLTEVQLAILLDGLDGAVCQEHSYPSTDFELRIRLCYLCLTKLRHKGESISRSTGICIRALSIVVYQPAKISAELHRLEAEAVAQNQSAQTVSEAYVVSRAHYRQRAKNDAIFWLCNAERLQEEETAEHDCRIDLRRKDIAAKLFALGYIAQDVEEARSEGWWCTACFHRDYEHDFNAWKSAERWRLKTAQESLQHARTEDQPSDRGVLDNVSGIGSYEQELAEFEEESREEIMAAMLAQWHSSCIPAPAEMLEFVESDERLTGEEWDRFKGPLVELADRERSDRFGRLEETIYAAHQKGQARPSTPFLAFPILKTLGTIASLVFDSTGWPDIKDQIVNEIRTRARLDKIILFDRMARAHYAENTLILLHLTRIVAFSSSPFVDCDLSNGLAPLHAALTDHDMDPLFAQVTSLFRCGICSTKLPYPDIAIHLFDDHDVLSVPAYAHVPSSDFRKAIKSLLDVLGHSSQVELTAFEVFYADCRFDVTTRTAKGELETSVGETCAQVLSGKSPAELDASRLKLSHSTDRNIIEIKFRPPASAMRTRRSRLHGGKREEGSKCRLL
ncbi:hypothetical protein JCM10296v2_005735 [Rhodotorula toruloides]